MDQELICINSDEDLKIYKDNNHLRIFAGPGAGKTHLLIENVRFIVQNSPKIKNSHRKILCITYTNAAADEIRKRLGSYSKYVFVSTIHSFINEYILTPNQLQLKLLIKNYFQFDISDKIKITSQQEGFTTLTGHSKNTIFEFISKNYSHLENKAYSSLSRKKMVDCSVDITPVNQVNSTGNEKVDYNAEDVKLDKNIIKAIKHFTWGVAGKLTFDETLYFGLRMIKEYELIKHMIRVEFPYIFVDEYQDTNPIQNILIKDIAQKGCILSVVGDIAQSIYSFQGASYLDFLNFSFDSSLPVKNYRIENNRRSTSNIIKFNNYIRKLDTTIQKQECAKNYENNDLVTFIIQKDSTKTLNELNVLDFDNAYVLCRRWADAFPYIKNIEKDQLKLLESINSTYSYVLKRDLFTEVEAGQEMWIDSAIIIAQLEDSFKRKCIPTAIEILQRFIDFKPFFISKNEEDLKAFNTVIHFWESTFANINGEQLLMDVINDINSKMLKLGLEIAETLPYPEKDSEEYFETIYKNVDKLKFKTARKMAMELFTKEGKFMTIHKAKGREFKTVLVNGTPFRDEKNNGISAENCILNPTILSAKSSDENIASEEFTRILYVGFSRAINKLYIHLYGDENLKEQIDVALKKYNDGKNDFYDFIIC